MEYIEEKRAVIHYHLPLNEIIYDFFDALKSRSRGYASFDYEMLGYEQSELVKLDILINKMCIRDRGGAVLIVVFLVVLSLGILVAGWFVRPLGRITASIENVTEGYESEWLHVGTFSETGQLSDAFNKMLGRLKQLNDSREEFVSNVSHELKTCLLYTSTMLA